VEQLLAGGLSSLQLDRRFMMKYQKEMAEPGFFERFLDALSQDKGCMLTVFLSDAFLEKFSLQDLCRLLTTVGTSLRRLQTLRLYCCQQQTRVPVSVIAATVMNLPQLEGLIITRSLQLLSDQDVQLLANALQDHPGLSEVKFLDLSVGKDENTGKAGTTAIVQVDPLEPMLLDEDVEVEESAANNKNETIPTVATGAVSLDPLLFAIASIPRLETVDMTMNPSAKRWMKTVEPATLAVLCKSPHLQDLSLWEFGLQDEHLEAMQPVIIQHPTLQFLSLRRNPGISSTAWHQFYDGLEHGYTLCYLYNDDAEMSDVASTFLGLNLLGRGRLFQQEQPDEDEWFEFLGLVSDCTDSLFTLLKADPAALLPDIR
jgi:hypothetical protein